MSSNVLQHLANEQRYSVHYSQHGHALHKNFVKQQNVEHLCCSYRYFYFTPIPLVQAETQFKRLERFHG